MALTPEQEARYALDSGVDRSRLGREAQAEYDRLRDNGGLQPRAVPSVPQTPEQDADVITISHPRGELRFDDQGVTVRNWSRTHQIGWAEVRCFTDGTFLWGGDEQSGGTWALCVMLHNGRPVKAGATARRRDASSEMLVSIGQAAQRYNIPADLAGTIERGSFPATLLGTSQTITVTIRDAHLADDSREAVLEVIQRTEPVQPGDILTLSCGDTEVEVLAVRQIFGDGHWEQVAYAYAHPASAGMNMNPELDEHGIPREARPPRKWPGYLLAGIGLASGIGQMYWAVSIASTQMVGVYHRWTHNNEVPLLPSYVAWIVSIGVLVWLGRGGQDKYNKTEKRVLYTVLILAMTLAAIGWGVVSLIEPYSNTGGD